MPFNRFTRYCVSREEGGWGYSTNVHTGRLLPEETPYTFICYFSRKRYPFLIPSIDKWYHWEYPPPLLRVSTLTCTHPKI